MGLDFSKASAPTEVETVEAEVITEPLPTEKYDIVADRDKMRTELVNTPEVDALVSTIEIDNLDTIVSFGAQAADEISKASDIVLRSMDMKKLDESTVMLNTLAKIMEKFDIDEIKDKKYLQGELPVCFVELKGNNLSDTEKNQIKADIMTYCNSHLEERGRPVDIILADIPLTSIGKNDYEKLKGFFTADS